MNKLTKNAAHRGFFSPSTSRFSSSPGPTPRLSDGDPVGGDHEAIQTSHIMGLSPSDRPCPISEGSSGPLAYHE